MHLIQSLLTTITYSNRKMYCLAEPHKGHPFTNGDDVASCGMLIGLILALLFQDGPLAALAFGAEQGYMGPPTSLARTTLGQEGVII